MRAMYLFTALMLLGGLAFASSNNRPALAGPSATQAASFKHDISSTGWIPFNFLNGKSVLVPAKINGHDVFVKLIDGAETSYIDKSFAASQGLMSVANAKGSGVIDVQVQLGALTLPQVKATVVNLGVKPSDSPLVPFILSDDLFNAAIVDIDFAHDRISFKNPQITIKPPSGAMEIPLIRRLGSLTVPVSVEGNAPVPFEWYLGDPAPVTVYEPYREAQQLLQNKPTSIRLGGGLGGQRPQEPVATLSHIQFAGVNFFQVPAVFPSNAVRGSDSPLISGNIGLALLSRFRLVIDYPHGRLYAAPYTAMKNNSFTKDRLGMYFSQQSSYLVVDFVSPGSPAQKAGFEAGERIAAINHKPFPEWRPAELAALGSASSGGVIVFTMQNGNDRQVKARDYF